MYNDRDKFRVEGLIIGLLIGAIVAAITSLLFAPKSGKDLRKDISHGTKEAWDHADEYLDTARKKGQEVVHDVSETASSYFDVASDKAKDAASKTKNMFNRKSSKAEKKVQNIAKDIGQKVDHITN